MADPRGLVWRARARARLEPLVADLDARDTKTTLSWFAITQLLEGTYEEAPFLWSARTARTSVGFPALQELAAASIDGRKLTPLEAVNRVVERSAGSGREGWAEREGAALEDWLHSIGDGGRAAVIRDAVTWVTACRTLMRWPPRDIRARGEGGCWATVRKDVLQLSTRIDIGSWKAPGVIDTDVATSRTPASLAYVALVRTMDTAVLPTSVHALHLPSGERSTITTTDPVLEDALELCAFALERWSERAD